MVDYTGVILGGVIGIAGAVVVELLRGLREDKYRREALEQRRLDAAHDFFRRVYNAVKPFLKAYSQLTYGLMIVVGFDELQKLYPVEIPDERVARVELREMINDLSSSMKNLVL